MANTLAPELTADLNSLAASLMPGRSGIGRTAVTGSESESSWSPSVLTCHPGQQLQETGGGLHATRQQDRDDREPGLARLAHQRQLALILLRVAQSVRAYQQRHRPGAPDRLLERRHPAQPGPQLAAVEEGVQTLASEPLVELPRQRPSACA